MEEYLKSQGACVFSNQKVGKIHKVRERGIEKQIPKNFTVFSCKSYSYPNHVFFHYKRCWNKAYNSNRRHVHEQVHRIQFLPEFRNMVVNKYGWRINELEYISSIIGINNQLRACSLRHKIDEVNLTY